MGAVANEKTTESNSRCSTSYKDKITVTTFRDVKDLKGKREVLTIQDLWQRIRNYIIHEKYGHLPIKVQKLKLPMIKLGIFKGSRSKDHFSSISGVELDVDGGRLTPERVAERLEKADVCALVYSSPGHSADQSKYRVLAFCSRELPVSKRRELLGRLNAIVKDGCDPSTFDVSRCFFFGRCIGGSRVETYLRPGRFIDHVTEVEPVYPVVNETSIKAQNDDYPGPMYVEGKLVSLEQAKAIVEAQPLVKIDDYKEKRRKDVLWKDDYGSWRDVGFALHHQFEGSKEALELFNELSKGGRGYDLRENIKHWNGFKSDKKNPITLRTLNFRLPDGHPAKLVEDAMTPQEVEDMFDDVSPISDRRERDIRELIGGVDEEPRGRLIFLSPAECATAPRREYLIKHLLAAGDIGCIFGAPGAGKSLIAPYLGYMLAVGREAFGLRTRNGGVFYVAAEDETGMGMRVGALNERHKDAREFKLVKGCSDLFSNASPDLKELQRAVADQKPRLIIIDTIAMAFPGLEENSAESMGRVVQVAKSLTKFGAAVLLIHHSRKDGAPMPRGHSILNGAFDMAIHVVRGVDGIVRGRLSKNRNGPENIDIAFAIGIVEQGKDQDGDAITSAICEPCEGCGGERREGLSGKSADVLNALSNGMTEKEWRAAYVATRPNDKSETAKRVWRRERLSLNKKGRVIENRGRCYEADSFNIFHEEGDDLI